MSTTSRSRRTGGRRRRPTRPPPAAHADRRLARPGLRHRHDDRAGRGRRRPRRARDPRLRVRRRLHPDPAAGQRRADHAARQHALAHLHARARVRHSRGRQPPAGRDAHRPASTSCSTATPAKWRFSHDPAQRAARSSSRSTTGTGATRGARPAHDRLYDELGIDSLLARSCWWRSRTTTTSAAARPARVEGRDRRRAARAGAHRSTSSSANEGRRHDLSPTSAPAPPSIRRWPAARRWGCSG